MPRGVSASFWGLATTAAAPTARTSAAGLLTINYCAGAMRQQENLMLAVSRERAASFPPELRRILGWIPSSRGVGHVDAGPPERLLKPFFAVCMT